MSQFFSPLDSPKTSPFSTPPLYGESNGALLTFYLEFCLNRPIIFSHFPSAFPFLVIMNSSPLLLQGVDFASFGKLPPHNVSTPPSSLMLQRLRFVWCTILHSMNLFPPLSVFFWSIYLYLPPFGLRPFEPDVPLD